MTRIAIVIAAALAFTATLPIVPAQAQRDRTFVASYGTDNGNTLCSFGSPCKTFQNAINNTAVGGEVTAIDSAGFGTFNVLHAITITSPNGVEAGIATPSGGTAITINAESPSDIIQLNGLTLDGVGGAATGIQFNTGGTLRVQNCVIRNFANDGIQFSPDASTQLFVSNTLVSENGSSGIEILANGSGTTTGVLDHVTMENNHSHGLFVLTVAQTVNVTVSDSVSANNTSNGIYAESSGAGLASVMVWNSTIANNGNDGLLASGAAVIRVTRSTITGNTSGWAFATTGTPVSTGIVWSYADNNIDGNGGNNSTPGSAIPYH